MSRLVFMLAACAAFCFAGNADAGCRSSQAGCQGHQAKATGCVGAQGCTSVQAGCHGFFGGRLLHREVTRVRSRGVVVQPATPAPPPAPMPKASATTSKVAIFGEVQSSDALDAANAQRAKRGLRPFQRDDGLMAGALACAEYRAKHRLAGHTRNDFAFLPAGATAKVGGCSALESSWGFQSCALYENWQTAGAASVQGSDGLVYHQLFVK